MNQSALKSQSCCDRDRGLHDEMQGGATEDGIGERIATRVLSDRVRENKEEEDGADGGGDHRWWRQKNNWKKLDLSPFNGKDPFAWLQKAKRFFTMREMEEDQWVSTTMMAMEGEAPSWYHWWQGGQRG